LKNKDYKGKTDLELAEQTHEIYKETFLSCHRSDINTWEKGTISKEIEVIPTVFGEKKIFDVYKIPVYYPDGKRKGLATIGRDITELQETQEKLIAAKEMAEESNKLKSAFLANMSHEIRTPMNGIIGFSQLLNTPDISKQKIKEYSDIITLSGKHLLNIIDDIIEIAKIDSGQIRMVKKTMNVNKVFYELFNFYNSNDIKKSNKKVDLRFYITLKDDEVNILSDETKFKQILTNLINNAIKFTDKGYIEFGYYKEIDRLIFYVKDTGIGIHSSKYGMIFERFTQANSNTEKLYGGTGLGLAISKAYVKLLEGSIYLDSEPQKGSTFYFSLPYEITETLTEKKSDIIDYELKGNNRIVLIVEDNEINIEYITELLSGMSLRFFAVRTSLEAIDFVKSQKPDLILMDIKLPDNDGNYTLKEIKKLYPDIPVIVQSAFAFENDKLKSFEAGCDDYIVKPIKKIELINKMKKYLKN
jgi:signal transduction histidine kinase/CheY-like chemotaxis protein